MQSSSLYTTLAVSTLLAMFLGGCGGLIEDPHCTGGRCQDTPTPEPTPEPIPSPSPAPTAAPTPIPEPDFPTESPPSDPTSNCPPPYMLETPDGQCVWSCGKGTEPAKDGRLECICSAGKVPVGEDSFGRRVCR